MSLPTDFTRFLDNTATRQGMTRSTFVRLAIMQKLNVTSMLQPEPAPADAPETQANRQEIIKKLAAQQPYFHTYDKQLQELLIDMEANQVQ